MPEERHQFVRIEFSRFKAFKNFSIDLRHFNVLVGPNNAGKSTIIAAFRILEAAMRKARRQRAQPMTAYRRPTLAHSIDIKAISVAEENIFHNYDDSEAATVKFHLSNGNVLTLYFPEPGTCLLLLDAQGKSTSNPSSFNTHFNCPIGFVPILGPVEHHEQLYLEETARRSLYTYGAARNFRNIWYHFPEHFSVFRDLLQDTWPGMDIEKPEIDRSHEKPRLHMYCPENRYPREIFWAGFGFQVWAQMLTHLVKSSEVSLFLIDEPDIYLHSELQRQLLGLLRNLGPDILIATHSTEIITEAETDDIVLVAKAHRKARRIRNPSQLQEVFRLVGSNINPILTQVAKTRRGLFVEGKDFQILGRFARRLSLAAIGNRISFAVVPIEGFNPERARTLKKGMEETLGSRIVTSVILDKDYRSDLECDAIAEKCETFCNFVSILKRKEIENFLLIPTAIDRAAARKVADRAVRSGLTLAYENIAQEILSAFATEKRAYIISQMVAMRGQFERTRSPGLNTATVTQAALEDFERLWSIEETRLNLLPGKEALATVNSQLQERYGVTVTPTAIIDAMLASEVPQDMKDLVDMLSQFVVVRPGADST